MATQLTHLGFVAESNWVACLLAQAALPSPKTLGQILGCLLSKRKPLPNWLVSKHNLPTLWHSKSATTRYRSAHCISVRMYTYPYGILIFVALHASSNKFAIAPVMNTGSTSPMISLILYTKISCSYPYQFIRPML